MIVLISYPSRRSWKELILARMGVVLGLQKDGPVAVFLFQHLCGMWQQGVSLSMYSISYKEVKNLVLAMTCSVAGERRSEAYNS